MRQRARSAACGFGQAHVTRRGQAGIGPNATLTFDLELVAIL